LADAIRNVRENVTTASNLLQFLAEGELCDLPRPAARPDAAVHRRAAARRDGLGAVRAYRGLYHVLLGRIAPLEGIGPEQLTIDKLVERVASGDVREVVMATNPNGRRRRHGLAPLLAPRMIQSMEILQLPIMALQERIEQEMNENPCWNAGEDPDLPEEPAERENPDAPDRSEKELVVDEGRTTPTISSGC
jgi:hypothetical protein